ncbi:MAG: hypothetical protein H5U18_08685 [Rhodobacteraceae bacterium]|nr:hypothetical protein [Paracoccaceae bacterium]
MADPERVARPHREDLVRQLAGIFAVARPVPGGGGAGNHLVGEHELGIGRHGFGHLGLQHAAMPAAPRACG